MPSPSSSLFLPSSTFFSPVSFPPSSFLSSPPFPLLLSLSSPLSSTYFCSFPSPLSLPFSMYSSLCSVCLYSLFLYSSLLLYSEGDVDPCRWLQSKTTTCQCVGQGLHGSTLW